MVNAVEIGFAGTHSSGKSTLARRVEMELRATGLTVTRTSGLAQRAAELGFPKMTRHTAESTEWIITASAAAVLENALSADVVLVDRTAHDAIAYYLAALQYRDEVPDPDTLAHLTTLAELHARRHRLLLATVLDPALPLAEHPRKDPAYQDPGFRTAVDQHLHAHLTAQHIKHLPVPATGHADAVNAAVAALLDQVAAA
ncbi:AAA family ATPase [Streptomyces sp. NPDC052396]|uniref:AAA family ATPase n=1 Tax=Streptomyces sp. NPDC052396 TaxID=3365689 RepID=UPI0037D84883